MSVKELPEVFERHRRRWQQARQKRARQVVLKDRLRAEPWVPHERLYAEWADGEILSLERLLATLIAAPHPVEVERKYLKRIETLENKIDQLRHALKVRPYRPMPPAPAWDATPVDLPMSAAQRARLLEVRDEHRRWHLQTGEPTGQSVCRVCFLFLVTGHALVTPGSHYNGE